MYITNAEYQYILYLYDQAIGVRYKYTNRKAKPRREKQFIVLILANSLLSIPVRAVVEQNCFVEQGEKK